MFILRYLPFLSHKFSNSYFAKPSESSVSSPEALICTNMGDEVKKLLLSVQSVKKQASDFLQLLKESHNPSVPTNLKVGDSVYRKGRLCTVRKIDTSIDPPVIDILTPDGREINTELDLLDIDDSDVNPDVLTGLEKVIVAAENEEKVLSNYNAHDTDDVDRVVALQQELESVCNSLLPEKQNTSAIMLYDNSHGVALDPLRQALSSGRIEISEHSDDVTKQCIILQDIINQLRQMVISTSEHEELATPGFKFDPSEVIASAEYDNILHSQADDAQQLVQLQAKAKYSELECQVRSLLDIADDLHRLPLKPSQRHDALHTIERAQVKLTSLLRRKSDVDLNGLSGHEALDQAVLISKHFYENHDADLRGQLNSLLANLLMNFDNSSSQNLRNSFTNIEREEQEKLDDRITDIELSTVVLDKIERDGQNAMLSYSGDLEARLAKLRLEMLQKRLRDFDIQACEARDLLNEHRKIETIVDNELNQERQMQRDSLRQRVAARKAARQKEAKVAKAVSIVLQEANDQLKASTDEQAKSRCLAKAMKLVFSLMRKIQELSAIEPIKPARSRPEIDCTVTEYERLRLVQSHLANVERLDEVLEQEKIEAAARAEKEGNGTEESEAGQQNLN